MNCAVISEGQQEEQRKQDGKRSASLYTENIIENDNNRDDCIYCAQETVHICACDMISEGQQQIMMGERMRGGAGGVGLTDLAVRLATRLGFCITAGTPNPAVGNCLIESAVFNINDRPELSELGAIEDTIPGADVRATVDVVSHAGHGPPQSMSYSPWFMIPS